MKKKKKWPMMYKITSDQKKSVISNGTTKIQSVVYTDPSAAKAIVDYFRPQFGWGQSFLDPCAGNGAFYEALPENKDWCELQKGRDFFAYDKRADWIITNPPWEGRVYAPFAERCLRLADNVVFLAKLDVIVGTARRLNDIARNRHGLKELIECDWSLAGFRFIDGSKKKPEGFVLVVAHMQRNWTGGTRWRGWTGQHNK